MSIYYEFDIEKATIFCYYIQTLEEQLMNVFALHTDPRFAAQMHADKHVVKMAIEYAQLMSTAHRVLDGSLYQDKTSNGRNIKRWS